MVVFLLRGTEVGPNEMVDHQLPYLLDKLKATHQKLASTSHVNEAKIVGLLNNRQVLVSCITETYALIKPKFIKCVRDTGLINQRKIQQRYRWISYIGSRWISQKTAQRHSIWSCLPLLIKNHSTSKLLCDYSNLSSVHTITSLKNTISDMKVQVRSLEEKYMICQQKMITNSSKAAFSELSWPTRTKNRKFINKNKQYQTPGSGRILSRQMRNDWCR